jgi:hypothetical protein
MTSLTNGTANSGALAEARARRGGCDSQAANLSPNPLPATGRKPAGGVWREEHERRLYIVAQKLLDGLSRWELVAMAMLCFHVGRRVAQKHVAAAELWRNS